MNQKSSSRRGALSRDRIVELAIEHADARGIEHLSMRRLAADLSVTPMALYWHFANRDAVVDAMAERVAAGILHDDEPDAAWQERLRRALTTAFSLFRSHPWLGPIVRHRIVTAPGYLGAMEVVLDTIRSAGYGPRAAVEVADFAIDSLSTMAARTAKEPQTASEDQLEMRHRLMELSGADYPRIREAAKPLTSPDTPRSFAKHGIDVLVYGIEAAAPRTR